MDGIAAFTVGLSKRCSHGCSCWHGGCVWIGMQTSPGNWQESMHCAVLDDVVAWPAFRHHKGTLGCLAVGPVSACTAGISWPIHCRLPGIWLPVMPVLWVWALLLGGSYALHGAVHRTAFLWSYFLQPKFWVDHRALGMTKELSGKVQPRGRSSHCACTLHGSHFQLASWPMPSTSQPQREFKDFTQGSARSYRLKFKHEAPPGHEHQHRCTSVDECKNSGP